ncbi:MAG: DUF4404 family protein [Pseudomonadales bacterium]|nr:DUF4404 family protein [Pseudomonadales bacterium]
MPEKDIKNRLRELREALEETDSPDDDLKDLLQQVDDEIHELLGNPERVDSHGDLLKERIDEITATFAARYPQTERLFREIVAALGRMGI